MPYVCMKVIKSIQMFGCSSMSEFFVFRYDAARIPENLKFI